MGYKFDPHLCQHCPFGVCIAKETKTQGKTQKATIKYINKQREAFLCTFNDFVPSVEMEHAMERYRHNEACIIPIILRPCDWQTTPFAMLQALPKGAKPISTWPNKDEALLDVVKGIKKVIDHIF